MFFAFERRPPIRPRVLAVPSGHAGLSPSAWVNTDRFETWLDAKNRGYSWLCSGHVLANPSAGRIEVLLGACCQAGKSNQFAI